MKFSAVTLLSVAGLASAQVDPAAATASLIAALPASIISVLATNFAGAESIISSELSGTTQPAWFLGLPGAVQTYFITSALAAETSAASAAVSAASSAVASASQAVSNATAALGSISSSVSAASSSSTASKASSSSSSSSSKSTSSSSGLAALPTGLVGGAIAGAFGMVAILAL